MSVDTVVAYPPRVLREYAFLGDGRRRVLVGPRRDIDWMCAPHWESDTVFAGVLGGAGVYAVTPPTPGSCAAASTAPAP